MSTPALLAAALEYAARGWPVFPCHPKTKRPLTPKGEDAEGKANGSGGLKLATTDAQKITVWWMQFPKALIGVRCGPPIGAFVVDFDAGIDEETGEIFEAEALIENLEHAIEAKLPETWTVATPRGGRHLYFQLPKDAPIGNRAELLGKGSRIDVRGDGGYVCVPPSARPDGKGYAWLLAPKIKGELPAKPPQSLIDCVLRQGKFEPADWPAASARNPRDGSLGGEDARARTIRSYSLAALDGQTRSVEIASEGGRNNALNLAALALGHLVGAGALTAPVVRAALEDACVKNGLIKSDGIKSVRDTISSGLTAGMKQPADLSKIGKKAGRKAAETRAIRRGASTARAGRREAKGITDDTEADARAPEYSDEALALAFAELYVHKLRYVAAWNKWLIWNGSRWRDDSTLHVFAFVRRLCREVARDCDHKKTALDIARASTVAAVERLARADRRLAAVPDQWDADPWLLNTPGGMIDLRTGKCGPHHLEDYATKITGAAPDPACPTPVWKAFLNRVTKGDDDLIAFLHRMFGYALTGSTREHGLFFVWGPGGNGKTKFIEVLIGCLGDYHKTAPIETFVASKTDRHPTELAGLRGARLVTAVETEEGRRWAESKIKQVTGGDRIAARFMRGDFFEFDPIFKLLIVGNHRPGLRSVDEAIRRRLHMINFDAVIPLAERDATLGDKLKAEWPGVLAWAIEGCLAWQAHGLVPPAAVQSATASYLEAEDSLAAWAEQAATRDANAFETATDLFRSWETWAKRAGEWVGSLKKFSQRLEDRAASLGLCKHRNERGRGFIGLRLANPASDASEPPAPAEWDDIAI
jgi:putative DNA primase/helicase